MSASVLASSGARQTLASSLALPDERPPFRRLDEVRHHLTNDGADGSGRSGDCNDGANGACSNRHNRAGRRAGNNHAHKRDNRSRSSGGGDGGRCRPISAPLRCPRTDAPAPIRASARLAEPSMIIRLKATAETSVIRFRVFIGCSFSVYLSLAALASRLDEADANGVEEGAAADDNLSFHNCGSPAVDSCASISRPWQPLCWNDLRQSVGPQFGPRQ